MLSWASCPGSHSAPYHFLTVGHCVPSPHRDQKLPEGGLHASDFFPTLVVSHLPPGGLLESVTIRLDEAGGVCQILALPVGAERPGTISPSLSFFHLYKMIITTAYVTGTLPNTQA